MIGSPAGLVGLTEAVALLMGIAFLGYGYVVIVPYLRHRPTEPGDQADFQWHFLVPCRDEEAVIGDTLRYLCDTFPHARVWVIDDDSDDRTVEVVRWLRHADMDRFGAVHLVRRYRPRARTGKGAALNAAYLELRRWIGRHADRNRQIVAVVDAAGRPAPDCLDVCAGAALFGDPRVGAVRVDVRMSARGARGRLGRLLVRMQDLEFRTAIAAIAMGGAGQFARLSALDSIAGPLGEPWRGSPATDLGLGVHLRTAGWRTGFSMDTHVQRQGLDSPRRLFDQRARWGHGTMRCARRIWASTHLGPAETLGYLAGAWLRPLGTLVCPIPLLLLAGRALADPGGVWRWLAGGAWPPFAAYGALGVLPFLVWGPIYWWKCDRRIGPLRALGYGACYALYSYALSVSSLRTVYRLILGRDGRARTRRNAENPDGVIAVDH